jgi:hypothetical protein
MIDFSDLKLGQVIYIIEEAPITILKLRIVGLSYEEDEDSDDIEKLKVSNNDITFEVEFDSIVENTFNDKDMALTIATKRVFDETNKYISELTDGFFKDYFDLDDAVERYKKIHPEMFI